MVDVRQRRRLPLRAQNWASAVLALLSEYSEDKMKKLIVNPPSTVGLKMLDMQDLGEAAVSKALNTNRAKFKPTIVTEGHLKLFVANVGYRIVPISNYVGAELTSMEAALIFFNDFARFAYRNVNTNALNDYWPTNLLKSEIEADRSENTVYGVSTSSPEMLSRIPTELNLIADVEVHQPVSQADNQKTNNHKKRN
jgi:hypothetical protein